MAGSSPILGARHFFEPSIETFANTRRGSSTFFDLALLIIAQGHLDLDGHKALQCGQEHNNLDKRERKNVEDLAEVFRRK